MTQDMGSNAEIELAVVMVPVIAVSAFGILSSCLAVILRMSAETNHAVRLFYTTIATGAFGELFAVFSGHRVSIYEGLMIIGLGLMFLFDRRSIQKQRIPFCQCDDREAKS